MKIIALIPFYADYKSLEGSLACRPLIKISGKSLINRTIEILNHVESINDTIVFTSDSKVSESIDNDMDYKVIRRSDDLNSNQSSIEDVIEGFLQISDADIIVLIHPRSPFIRPKTIKACIDKVLVGDTDSAFLARNIQRNAWFEGKPLNFSNHKDTPSLSKLSPILIESSSFYVFTRELFESNRRRIGESPYIREIGHLEGFEVDNQDDLIMAELIINAGLDKEVL
jgi:CMP-N-acetylneuraminic acid synthetase